jgi:PncC family amidohydrolase
MEADSDRPIEHVVGQALIDCGATVATAESCTGGLLGARLTSLPGASTYYVGTVVAYHNEAKKRLLGVAHASLMRHGAVSEHVAREMATGVRNRFRTDYGISVTGVAGPGGGTEEKPVGLVYLGIAAADGVAVHRFVFKGDRADVRRQTADEAFGLLLHRLQQAATAS